MIMMVFMPIIFIFVGVGMFMLFSLIIKKSGKTFFASSHIYMILSIYFLILLVSVGIVIAKPNPKNTLEEFGTPKEPIEYGIAYDIVYEQLPVEDFNDYKDEEWEFELVGEELTVQSTLSESYDTIVLIEEKEEADGLVEVAAYSTPALANGINLSGIIEETKVNFLKGDIIEVVASTKEVNVASFEKEFVFNQFSKKNSAQDQDFLDPQIELGESFLYIKIPKHVKIKDEYDLEIEYIK